MLQKGFFLEQKGVASFLAKTCVTHTVQLRTPVQSVRNGGVAVADQGDLHHPFKTNWLPALWLPPERLVTSLLVVEQPGTVA